MFNVSLLMVLNFLKETLVTIFSWVEFKRVYTKCTSFNTCSSTSGAFDVFQKPRRKKLSAHAGTLKHLASYAQVKPRL